MYIQEVLLQGYSQIEFYMGTAEHHEMSSPWRFIQFSAVGIALKDVTCAFNMYDLKYYINHIVSTLISNQLFKMLITNQCTNNSSTLFRMSTTP